MELDKVKKALKTAAGRPVKAVVQCEVLEVNEDEGWARCAPFNGDAEFLRVRLRSKVMDGTFGQMTVPKVGSVVHVGIAENNPASPFLVMASEITRIVIVLENGSKLEMKANGEIVFNDGSYDGLIQISKLVDKINQLENNLNQLTSAFNSHSHNVAALPAPGTPPPVIPTLVPTAPANTLIAPLTQKVDIENPHIKHGPKP